MSFVEMNKQEEQSARGDMSSWLGFKSYRRWYESMMREEHPSEDDFRAYDDGKRISPLRLETDEDLLFDHKCRIIHEHAAHCPKCRETLKQMRS